MVLGSPLGKWDPSIQVCYAHEDGKNDILKFKQFKKALTSAQALSLLQVWDARLVGLRRASPGVEPLGIGRRASARLIKGAEL